MMMTHNSLKVVLVCVLHWVWSMVLTANIYYYMVKREPSVHFFFPVALLELIPALMPLLGQIEAVINGFGIQSQIVFALGSKIKIRFTGSHIILPPFTMIRC
jgi:hypothetical protein